MYVDGVFEWHSASDILFPLFPFSLSVVPTTQSSTHTQHLGPSLYTVSTKKTAATNLQPKPLAECTQEPSRHPTSSQHSLDVISTVSGGRQWSEHQMRRTKG
jgi:hypothetical protein